MASPTGDSLERLQGLKNDLSMLSSSTLPNIDRLSAELEARALEFRTLLDRKPKSDKSRQALSSGPLNFEDQEFTVNDDFKQQAIQVADALDYDEVESAKLFLDALQEADSLNRSPLASCIFLYHEIRQYSLECIRLIFEKAAAQDIDEDVSNGLKQFISLLFQNDQGQLASGSSFWNRCLDMMTDIEKMIGGVNDRLHTVAMTDQRQAPEFAEIMDFQRSSLAAQHASLGAVEYWVAKSNYTKAEDLTLLMRRLRPVDRYDATLVHYLPALFCSLNIFASTENLCPAAEAKPLSESILSPKDNESWSFRNLHAAVIMAWVVHYSARQSGLSTDSDTAVVDSEVEFFSSRLKDAIDDGALQFILAVCQDVRDKDWIDPARQGFVSFLLQDAPNLHIEPFATPAFLHDMMCEQLQLLAEAFITNMPDTLRQLKFREDERRMQAHARVQLRQSELEFHFERFLLIIAYAFEGYPEASMAFWEEPDGQLFGFLDWASQRQSTPRSAAFCEMLGGLAEGQECADAAHDFLYAENVRSSARLQRQNLSWAHVVREIEFYSSTNKDRPSQFGSRSHGNGLSSDQLVEPESAMMLESFLRLFSRLCKESPQCRNHFLNTASFNILEQLLRLCSSSIDSRLRACSFTALTSLLTDKSIEINDGFWNVLDNWISGNASYSPVTNRAPNIGVNAGSLERMILQSLSNGFEESNAFVALLCALVDPVDKDRLLKDYLPFPENLGSANRISAMEPYVDFVLGLVFASKSTELEDQAQLRIMRSSCLQFAVLCLSAFNEELVMFANRSDIVVDSAMQASSLKSYVLSHPLARVMEWMFNDKVVSALFAAASQDVTEVTNAAPESSLVLSLMRSIQVMDLVLAKQTTYFDIVRRDIKLTSANRGPTVADSALASFEDAVLNNLDIVSKLALYCGSGHEPLIIASLNVLQKLSSSRKLAAPVPGHNKPRFERSRLITQLENDGEGENTSRCLGAEMRFDDRELEQGPQCPGSEIKSSILTFLSSSIDAAPERPVIAHLLLGFTCGKDELDITDDGTFASGSSLFHAIVTFLMECPIVESNSVVSWLASLRNQAWQVLRKLWRAALSSQLTMAELRIQDFVFGQSLRQSIISPETLWDGRSMQDPEFYISSSSEACTALLRARSAFFEHAAMECRFAKDEGIGTLLTRLQSSLFGTTTLLDGETLENPSVFELLDFLELEIAYPSAFPSSQYFDTSVFEICRQDDGGCKTYDTSMALQLLTLRRNETHKQGVIQAPAQEQQIQAELEQIYLCILANNNQTLVSNSQVECLEAWTRLVTIMLDCIEMESSQKIAFALQLLHICLPRLERLLRTDMEMATILAKFSRTLLRYLELSRTLKSADKVVNEDAHEKVLQLFRVSLLGVQSPDTPVELRDICCQICQAYLAAISIGDHNQSPRRQALQSTLSSGQRLTGNLCEDAIAGENAIRVSALALLDAIVTISNLESSKEILHLFNRLNFIQIQVDHVGSIPSELTDAPSEGKVKPQRPVHPKH